MRSLDRPTNSGKSSLLHGTHDQVQRVRSRFGAKAPRCGNQFWIASLQPCPHRKVLKMARTAAMTRTKYGELRYDGRGSLSSEAFTIADPRSVSCASHRTDTCTDVRDAAVFGPPYPAPDPRRRRPRGVACAAAQTAPAQRSSSTATIANLSPTVQIIAHRCVRNAIDAAPGSALSVG